MRERLRHLFRTRCRAFIERGNMIYGMRNPDLLNPDGSITEGTRIEVFGSILCTRRRFHRGEHRHDMKPCVPIHCPPVEEYEIDIVSIRHNWEHADG